MSDTKSQQKKRIILILAYAVAIILGVINGLYGIDFTIYSADVLSMIFIRLFKFIAVPLIAVSIICTISSAAGDGSNRLIFKRVLLYTFSTTVLAASVAAILYNIYSPSVYSAVEPDLNPDIFADDNDISYVGNLVNTFPDNIFGPFIEGKVLSVLFVALLFGAAINHIQEGRARDTIVNFFNALQQMLVMNPELQIRHDASYHDMYYMNQSDTALEHRKVTPEARKALDAFNKKHQHPERVMRLLFNDDNYWQNEINANDLYKVIFNQAGNMQSTELRHDFTLYDLFTDDEIYDLWVQDNARWYVTYGPSPLNGGTQPYSQRNLLRKIISEADSCIQLKHPGATLRYGHDTMVMPLTCLLDLDGMGKQITDFEQLDKEGWRNYRIFPMACNIQFVFYRPVNGKGDILFKVLRNENEATLPIKAVTGPYYRWQDFKDYFLKKLDAYEK